MNSYKNSSTNTPFYIVFPFFFVYLQHPFRQVDGSHIDPKDFLHEVQFSAAIEAAHFPAVETGLLKPAVSCHFHKNKRTISSETKTETDNMKISGLRLLLVPIVALVIASCGTKKAEDVRREVTFVTTKGDIVVQLFNETPLHRDNFLQHVQSGYYDSLLFHRVIADFMIQSGDSTSRHAAPEVLIADESDTATVPAEFRYPAIFHRRGVLAAARTGDDVNPEQASSAAQFYIVWGKTYNDSLLTKIDPHNNCQELYKDIKFKKEK